MPADGHSRIFHNQDLPSGDPRPAPRHPGRASPNAAFVGVLEDSIVGRSLTLDINGIGLVRLGIAGAEAGMRPAETAFNLRHRALLYPNPW